jgi:hypothetical protein
VPTIAYIFSADDLQSSDFDLIYRAIFGPVLALMPEARFDLRSGRLLLWTFSYRTRAVERGKAGRLASVGRTLTDDKALRTTLAVAFAKSVAAQYHHVCLDALSIALSRQEIECVTASELSLQCSDLIHEDLLRQCPAYFGRFAVSALFDRTENQIDRSTLQSMRPSSVTFRGEKRGEWRGNVLLGHEIGRTPDRRSEVQRIDDSRHPVACFGQAVYCPNQQMSVKSA